VPAGSSAAGEPEITYRHIFDAVDQGILIQNAQGFIVSANPAACRILALSESEVRALRRELASGWRLVDERGADLAFDELPGMRALSTGRSVDGVVFGLYLPHLHMYRWISSSSVPLLRAGEARPHLVISTFSDITQLKRQSDLFEMTQRLAEIGGWELDDMRNALYWTSQVYRLHDMKPGSPITESQALDHYGKEERELLRAALHKARTMGEGFELELPTSGALERVRWVRIVGQPLLRHDQVYGVAGTVQDITARKLAEQKLQRMVRSDRVTGLPNHETVMEALERALANADSSGAHPALLYIDLDRFHLINATAGHEVGDRLLIEAAERICRCAAGTRSMVGRFIGDEFVVLLRDAASDENVAALAESIVAAFRKPFVHEQEEFTVTASVGIVSYPRAGTNVRQLVNHAHAAMAEAKRRGRNRSQPFAPELSVALVERTRIERQLRRALDNHELRLAYQPVFALSDGHITGAEALLRWRNRNLGEIMPSRFIAHAENSGEIVRIGAWVVAQACRQWRAWRDAGHALDHIAVNVSFRQLLSGTLLQAVRAAIEEHALPPETLELELTERALIEDAPDAHEIFAALKRMGVRLLIDDFGEGYSSLNYLRRLPLDGLKISHAFVQGIPDVPADCAICEAIVRLADSLQLDVIAEGVETEAQRAFFARHHATSMQGHLLAHPLDEDAMRHFLAANATRH